MQMSILDCRNHILGLGNGFVKLEFLLRSWGADTDVLVPLIYLVPGARRAIRSFDQTFSKVCPRRDPVSV